MTWLDSVILHFVAYWSEAPEQLDRIVAHVAYNDLFKGFAAMAVVWWLWFRNTPDAERTRDHIAATVVACLVALFVARVLAHLLPFRPRPFSLPEFAGGFILGRTHKGLETWSAFPSDHATLFVTLAVGVWFASHRVGALLMAYVVLVILLPRIYLGMHYPTDILGGAAIGCLIAWAANSKPLMQWIARPLALWRERWPSVFYAGFFLLTAQIAVLFDPVRHLGRFTLDFLSGHF